MNSFPRRISFLSLTLAAGLATSGVAALGQAPDSSVLTPGNNLIIESLPPVPLSLVQQASPYLENRSASFLSWDPSERQMLITTRFAQSAQIHRVAMPGGARSQLTFYADPVRTAIWQPKQGKYFVFAKDTGGGEFYQLYRYNEPGGEVTLLTDGKSRNTGPDFSRDGSLLAYGSTQRDGDDVDLWVMDPLQPSSAHLLTQWKGGGMGVLDWSPDGAQILAADYRSINDTTLCLVDAKTGERHQLTPTEPETATVAWSSASFTADGKSIYTPTTKARNSCPARLDQDPARSRSRPGAHRWRKLRRVHDLIDRDSI